MRPPLARTPATLLVALALMMDGSGHAQAQEASGPRGSLHTWKDTTGRFRVDAKFVAVEGDKVTIEKADGTQLEVPLDRLSPADRDFAAEQQKLAADDPFRPKDPPDDPFKPKPQAPKTAAAPRSRRAPVDWWNVPNAALPAAGEWKVAVPSPTEAKTGDVPVLRPILLPPTTDFFEKLRAFVLDAAGTTALVAYTLDGPGAPARTRFLLCDLKSGKITASTYVPQLLIPLALADGGSEALVCSQDVGFGKRIRLELWRLASDRGFERAWECIPYDDLPDNDRGIQWAAFLGPKRFATLGEKGRFAIWDVDPLRPTLTLAMAGGSQPAVSPDGKLLAFAIDRQIGILDLDAARIMALTTVADGREAAPAPRFSPSGRRIAGGAGSKLLVWDTATGKLDREVLLTPLKAPADRPVAWTDEDHVLIGGHFLVDVTSQVRLWDYQGYDLYQPARDGTVWVVAPATNDRPGALVPGRFPHAAATEALKKAQDDPDFFVLRPGATVSIDAGGIPDTSKRSEVVGSLTRRLEAIGVQVAPDDAELVLRASVEPGRPERMTYRPFGGIRPFGPFGGIRPFDGPRTDTFTVRPQISRLKFVYRDQTLWETESSSMPVMDVASLRNESLDEHVRKFDRPNYSYFDTVELPRLLARPGDPGVSRQAPTTLGRSVITPAGV